MINVLLVCPDAGDATSWWRGAGPWQQLNAPDICVRVAPPTLTWVDLVGVDVVVAQRPCTPAHVTLIKSAQAVGAKVIADYDDDVLNVPVWNPRYPLYSKPETRESIEQSVALADAVIVSTEGVGDSLGAGKAQVVPNAWAPKQFGPLTPLRRTQPVVLWRGSDTHNVDVMTHADALEAAFRRHTDLTWMFVGQPPWEFIARLTGGAPSPRVRMLGGFDPVAYIDVIRRMRPRWVVVPLEDSTFNRAKSNAGWLEATAVGANVLHLGGLPEWQRPGVFHDPEESLSRWHGDALDAAQAHVRSHYWLPDWNQERVRIIREVLA